MSASTTIEPNLAALQADIASLKQDVSSLIEHLKLGVTNGAENVAERLDAGAQRLYRTLADEGERSVKVIGQKVEEQPIAALLIALGVGYIGGRLMSK